LLLKKREDLKKLLKDEMACEDKTKNAAIREAIWGHYADDLQCAEIEIELAKLDAKNTWDQLKRYLPMYVLFQSDRKNSDGDSEVQNPMKLAVEEILKDERLSATLDNVANEVEGKLREVAAKTLEKLNEMNPEIANSLNPVIPSASTLKWVDVFKNVSITGDEDIPLNKRGSGVKRLVLLNFFRAEAERRKAEQNVPSIVYAVEEPETSQHPSHQRKLIEAFKELAGTENTQVLLTTHSPAIVKLLDFDHVKLVKSHPRREVVNVQRGNLPYPSLNEVNFLAFGESDHEYHNELYGFIESEGRQNDYKQGRPTILYIKETRNGGTREEQIVESEFIRHQIHHPENRHNPRFTDQQLQSSIREMRLFIQAQT
jgi:predicted ATP-dependent endonuclease of OLD family